MSKSIERATRLPTYDEMQAAMAVGRRLRAEAFAEFFGFAGKSTAKSDAATSQRTAKRSKWALPEAIFDLVRMMPHAR